MMFKTHLVLGLIAALLSIKYLNPSSWAVFGTLLVIASLAPDIDLSKSTIGRKFWPVSSAINFMFGHRGLIHTIFPPLIAALALMIAGQGMLGIAFATGYMTHLLADAATVQGIMLFFPFSRTRASGPVRTGGMLEYGIFFLASAGLLTLFVATS